MDTGELRKMQLVPFPDNTFTFPSGPPYTVLINPETYIITYATESNNTSTQGSSHSTSNFNKRTPQTLNFKFLFDGTGVIRSNSGPDGINTTPTILGGGVKRDVAMDLANFKRVVYDYSSAQHQPGFVQLQWGPLIYNCKLSKMTVTFKLFHTDGTPLRADADCSFEEVVNSNTLAAIENRMSPDLTHVHTVMKGDTLPLLCYKEYGDSSYYYQVGEFNGLTDFKKLIPGTKLIFPPLETPTSNAS